MEPVDLGVRVSGRVIDPASLQQRMTELRSEVTASLPQQATARSSELDARARTLHDLWWSVAPPTIDTSGGPRARAGGFVKRVIRRSTRWYVEPRWAGQREIDAEAARFASAAAVAIERLQAQIIELERANGELTKRVHRLERRRSEPTG